MPETSDFLSRLRVASPCPADWERMEGDERVRFCRLCNLHVYNFAELTRGEAAALVARTEGRLCGRLHRRADGTVLTRDCPTGLRALRRRVSRRAAAVFAALLGLCAPAFGQTRGGQKLSCEGGGQVTFQQRDKADAAREGLAGVVTDPNAAVIVGATVILTDEATKKRWLAVTSDEGLFALPKLPEGAYTLEVYSPGFTRLTVEHFTFRSGDDVSVRLAVAEMGDVVPASAVLTGVINLELDYPPADMESRGGKTVFRGRMLTDLPRPR